MTDLKFDHLQAPPSTFPSRTARTYPVPLEDVRNLPRPRTRRERLSDTTNPPTAGIPLIGWENLLTVVLMSAWRRIEPVKEEIYDPEGALARQYMRLYDILEDPVRLKGEKGSSLAKWAMDLYFDAGSSSRSAGPKKSADRPTNVLAQPTPAPSVYPASTAPSTALPPYQDPLPVPSARVPSLRRRNHVELRWYIANPSASSLRSSTTEPARPETQRDSHKIIEDDIIADEGIADQVATQIPSLEADLIGSIVHWRLSAAGATLEAGEVDSGGVDGHGGWERVFSFLNADPTTSDDEISDSDSHSAVLGMQVPNPARPAPNPAARYSTAANLGLKNEDL